MNIGNEIHHNVTRAHLLDVYLAMLHISEDQKSIQERRSRAYFVLRDGFFKFITEHCKNQVCISNTYVCFHIVMNLNVSINSKPVS